MSPCVSSRGVGEAEVVEHGDPDEHVAGALAQPLVERRRDADLDRGGEVPSPRQRQPPHQPAETGGSDVVDRVAPRRPNACSWAGSVAPEADTMRAAQHRPTLRGVVAQLQQRPDDVGEVVAAEEEERDRRTAQRGRQLARAQSRRHDDRLAPVVGLPLEADRVALDRGVARDRRTAGR